MIPVYLDGQQGTANVARSLKMNGVHSRKEQTYCVKYTPIKLLMFIKSPGLADDKIKSKANPFQKFDGLE